jgi:hypothetical protein
VGCSELRLASFGGRNVRTSEDLRAGEQWRVLANGISNRGAHDLSGTRLPGINVSMSRINQNVRSGHGASTAMCPLLAADIIERPGLTQSGHLLINKS